jgi:hypothetical protein
MRRAIVESYITATFGDPIMLLPAGVPMIVAGQPLYNEPGDVKQLYLIIEYITTFQYEVRIQSGLAIDQVGLERDLRFFTPAGLNIIFNYAWTGKWATDSGTASESIAAFTGSAMRISVSDAGVGTEAVRYFGTDTGVGTDIALSSRLATDTGTISAESAAAPTVKLTPFEGGVGLDDITAFRLTANDSGTSIENAVRGSSDFSG